MRAPGPALCGGTGYRSKAGVDMSNVTFRFAGDQALLVEFENEISIAVNQKVRSLKEALEKEHLAGLGELVPAYRSLLIHYDPMVIAYRQLMEKVEQYANHLSNVELPPAIVTEIPVCYEGEYAADIQEIARIEGKSVEEVIRIHSQSDYFVYMLGFAPGHPYAARMENPFSFKRRETPRVKIPGGSIVVQLGLSDIIPFDQPCGWNIIGTTPVLAYDGRKENPFLLQSGQWMRHVPISQKEFREIRTQVEAGTYVCKTYRKEA